MTIDYRFPYIYNRLYLSIDYNIPCFTIDYPVKSIIISLPFTIDYLTQSIVWTVTLVKNAVRMAATCPSSFSIHISMISANCCLSPLFQCLYKCVCEFVRVIKKERKFSLFPFKNPCKFMHVYCFLTHHSWFFESYTLKVVPAAAYLHFRISKLGLHWSLLSKL